MQVPPSSKLPGNSSDVLPGFKTMPVGNHDGSVSDMDTSSESEDHLYDTHYSFISLPQDGKLPNAVAQGHASLQKTRHGRGEANGSPHSASSIEVSFAQCRSSDDGIHHGLAHSSDSFSPYVTSHSNGFVDKQVWVFLTC